MSELKFPKVVNYQNIRHLLRSGDIVLFAGAYAESKMIRFFSGGSASHVGIVLNTRHDAVSGQKVVEVLEANHDEYYPELNGVVLSRLSDRIPFYKGDIWILRLKEAFREMLDFEIFEDFLMGEMGKEYDMATRWKSAIDTFDQLGFSDNKEDLQQYFCSELVAAAYKKAGGLPQINPSEITPADIYRWDIYEELFFQIKCIDYQAKPIENFSSISVMQGTRARSKQ